MIELGKAEQQYVTRCKDFATEVLEPLYSQYDETHTFAHDIHQAAYQWGLMNAAFPVELGGQGLRYRAIALGGLAMARVCAPTTFSMGFNHGALRPIVVAGSLWQRNAFIRDLIEARGYASWCMTESDVSGSNLMDICSRAEKVAGGWVLNGKKVMAGNGTVSSVFLYLADAWDNGQRLGLSIFVVPKDAGVVVGENTRKLGFCCLPTPDVTFQDIYISDAHLLGVAGGALQILLDSLDFMRFGGAIVIIGLASGAINSILPWLDQRKIYGGGRLSDQSHIQIELGRLLAELTAVECLLEAVVKGLEAGESMSQEAASLKILASELAMNATSKVVQFYGWRGIDARYPAEKRFRDARQTSIYEGTNEVLAMNLFRHVLQGYRDQQ